MLTLFLALSGCASLLGLEQLDTIPADFPTQLGAPTGTITRAPHGQVSVDLTFDKPEQARAHWEKLHHQLEAEGWQVDIQGRQGKLDRVVLLGDRGRIELGCCRPRADRQQLVFVSWWPKADQSP